MLIEYIMNILHKLLPVITGVITCRVEEKLLHCVQMNFKFCAALLLPKAAF